MVLLCLYLLFEADLKQYQFYHQLGMYPSKLILRSKHQYLLLVLQQLKYHNQQIFQELPDFHYLVSNILLNHS